MRKREEKSADPGMQFKVLISGEIIQISFSSLKCQRGDFRVISRSKWKGLNVLGCGGFLSHVMMAIKICNVSCLVAINKHFALCLHLKVCGQNPDLPLSH